MKNLIVGLSTFILFCSAIVAQPVYADCTTGAYGTTCDQPIDLTIDKEVKNPITNVYVENLGSTDPTFSPDSIVSFKLIVKNTSGETFSSVKIVDQFPDYLTYTGSTVKGDYDAGQRRLVMTLDRLAAGETREIEVTARVADKSAFATNDFFCASNYATVTSVERPNGDNNTAEFCMTARVNGATTLPIAGFNDLFTMIPFITLGGMGIALLKKNK